MKHGAATIEKLPFVTKRDEMGNYAHFSCRGCGAQERVNLAKNLPRDVIINKVKQRGWEINESKAICFCPDCKKTKGRPAGDTDEKLKGFDPNTLQRQNTGQLITEHLPTLDTRQPDFHAKFGTRALQGQIYFTFALSWVTVEETLKWTEMPRVRLEMERDRLRIIFSADEGLKGVRPKNVGNYYFNIHPNRLPFKLREDKCYPLSAVADEPFFVMPDGSLLEARTFPKFLRADVPASDKDTLKHEPKKAQNWEFDDGAKLLRQLNSWLNWAEDQRHTPEVSVSDNRVHIHALPKEIRKVKL